MSEELHTHEHPLVTPVDTNRYITDEYTKRLAVLETKLDYIIEHQKESALGGQQLSKRVDDLENHRHWMTGGVAALTLVSGLLLYSIRGNVQDIARTEVELSRLDGEQLLAEMCSVDRIKSLPFTERPKICQI